MSTHETDDQKTTTNEAKKRTWVEEIEISGAQLVERVEELLQESNTKRVVIKTPDGKEIMNVPLTLGVVAGGILTLGAPLLAALGAAAALIKRVKLEVVREDPSPPQNPTGDGQVGN